MEALTLAGWGSGVGATSSGSHPVRLAFGDDDDGVVQQSVQQAGGGGGVLGQETAPVLWNAQCEAIPRNFGVLDIRKRFFRPGSSIYELKMELRGANESYTLGGGDGVEINFSAESLRQQPVGTEAAKQGLPDADEGGLVQGGGIAGGGGDQLRGVVWGHSCLSATNAQVVVIPTHKDP